MKRITIEEALQKASFCLNKAGVGQPRLEAEMLLSNLLQAGRLRLFLIRQSELAPEPAEQFQQAVLRRCGGEPAAYITGEKHFYGYRFKMSKSVLIPRPETELLIERALCWISLQQAAGLTGIKCVDLGTGSGVLAVTLALEMPDIAVWAVDISAEALAQAKHNAAGHSVQDKITWLKGNYFEALREIKPQPSFNLVISNPPYLSKTDIDNLPRDIKEHEPLEALYGGEDGFDSYRVILSDLSRYIHKPALVLFEIGVGQQEAVEDMCQKTGLFSAITMRYDLAGHPRVLEGEIGKREYEMGV